MKVSMRQGKGREVELTARTRCDEVADAIEKEELGNDECLDQHDRTSGNNGNKTDDVHDADCVENYVTWTGQ